MQFRFIGLDFRIIEFRLNDGLITTRIRGKREGEEGGGGLTSVLKARSSVLDTRARTHTRTFEQIHPRFVRVSRPSLPLVKAVAT